MQYRKERLEEVASLIRCTGERIGREARRVLPETAKILKRDCNEVSAW